MKTFNNWYKLAAYEEEWQDKIEEIAKNNPYPFQHLFPNGNRIYLPFGISDEEGVDDDVKNLLEESGCTITNYREGYCTLDGRNQLKIGKFLRKLLKQETNRIKQENEQGNIYNVERELNDIQQYFERVMNTFQNSSYRKSKNDVNFYVVISQDPHDIAKMSTDRSWSSCMTLGEGSHHQDVFCEVQVGSLIAYLVKSNDKDINDPLARIRLRRFENKDGQSILMPEESVYGNPIEGFEKTVDNWLKSVQGNITSGLYNMKGGGYSDTFDDSKFIAPTSKEEILQLLRGDVDISQYTTYTIDDELFDRNDYNENEEVTHPTFNTEEEAKTYIGQIDYDDSWRDYYGEPWTDYDEDTGEYENDRYSIEKHQQFDENSLKDIAISTILNANKGEYSEDIIKEIKDMIFNPQKNSFSRSNYKREFIKKYPEMASLEDSQEISDSAMFDYIAKMPDGPDKDTKKQQIINGIKEDLMNPENIINDAVFSTSGATYDLWNYTANFVKEPLEKLFSPIPADVASLLADFTTKLLKGENIGLKHEETIPHEDKISIANSILPVFWGTKTDTPEVQRMYQNALPLWGSSMKSFEQYGGEKSSPINIDTLGFCIARLGENGRQFIPFLQEKLKSQMAFAEHLKQLDMHAWTQESETKYLEKSIEKHLYVIDALENGTGRSSKYRWSKNSSWYKLAKLTNPFNPFENTTNNWYK